MKRGDKDEGWIKTKNKLSMVSKCNSYLHVQRPNADLKKMLDMVNNNNNIIY